MIVLQVVHTQPSRQKSVDSTLDKFDQHDMLITVHKVVSMQSSSHRLMVNSAPSTLEGGVLSGVFIWSLPRNLSLEQWRSGVLSWQSSEHLEIEVSVPHMSEQEVCQALIRNMMVDGCFDNGKEQPKVDNDVTDPKNTTEGSPNPRSPHQSGGL